MNTKMVLMKGFKLFIVVAMALAVSSCWELGNGEKVGVITKLRKGGFFCKTWEAEIIRGGFNSGTGVSGASFSFTIEDESLVPKIQDALDNQKEIKISYRHEFMSFCRSDSGSDFLTKVTEVNPVGINRPVKTEVQGVVNTHEMSKEELSTKDKEYAELGRLIIKLSKENQ